MNQYPSNTLISLTMALTNAAGTAIDATIDLKIRTPDGVVTDYGSAVTNPMTGQYAATFLPTQQGPHQYEWIATGAAQVSAQGQFFVQPAIF